MFFLLLWPLRPVNLAHHEQLPSLNIIDPMAPLDRFCNTLAVCDADFFSRRCRHYIITGCVGPCRSINLSSNGELWLRSTTKYFFAWHAGFKATIRAIAAITFWCVGVSCVVVVVSVAPT